MLIDWFTVGAQALNFLILVWLLKHFLYKPILDAIDAREKLIATKLADASAKKAEAKKERDDFQQKNEEFDQQRAELLRQATIDAKAERQRLIDEARQAADALSTKRQVALKREQQTLGGEISRLAREEVFAVARKTLTDLAGTTLEERMGEVFAQRLRTLDSEAQKNLVTALKTSSDPVLVRSAFELPSAQRDLIQKTLNEVLSAEIQIRFEAAPELISGIELTASGQKLAWSISDYLASLEKSIGELLKGQAKPEAEPEAKPKPEPKLKPRINTKPVTSDKPK